MDAEDADFDAYVAEDAIDADAIEGGAVEDGAVEDDAIDAERLPEESAGSVEARESVGVASGEQGGQIAMVVPEPEPTGHADVDAAVERLRELSERPTSAHPDLYDGVHQRLQEVLAQIDHQDAGR